MTIYKDLPALTAGSYQRLVELLMRRYWSNRKWKKVLKKGKQRKSLD